MGQRREPTTAASCYHRTIPLGVSTQETQEITPTRHRMTAHPHEEVSPLQLCATLNYDTPLRTQ